MADAPNSDARKPKGNAWVARCFERRADVAGLPGNSAGAVLAENSDPAAASAKNAGGRVLFVSAAVPIRAPLLDAAQLEQ